ncbi:MAG: SurA N-terminal domain-containing protein [Patescibacteria group bacterium]
MVKFDPLLKNKKLRTVLLVLAILIVLALSKSLFVAALVNGWPISRLALIRELERQGGRKILDTLIERSLIFQEARRQGVKVSEEAVNQQVSSIEELLKKQNLTLEEALKARGQTKSDLTEQIRIQKTVEAILSQKINISAEDISQFFEENKETFGEGKTLEDVKEDIRSQLFQQKLTEAYSKWIEELKTKGKIFYFVNFP